jgi:hypothetical protein
MSRTVLLSKLRSAGCSEPLAPSFLTRVADGAECRSRVAYRETTAELGDLTASRTSSIRTLQHGRTHRAQRALNPGPDVKRPKAGAESTRQSRPAFDLPTFSLEKVWNTLGSSHKFQHEPLSGSECQDALVRSEEFPIRIALQCDLIM